MKKSRILISLFLIFTLLLSSITFSHAVTSTNKKVDLAFVIDSTGSMAGHIASVKDNITTFAQYLNDKGITLRIGVVEYRDITCDGMGSTIVHNVDHSVWQSTSEFKNTLAGIGANGGGDIPETAFDGLGYLTDNKTILWSSDAYKFAVLLTDASYKTDNRHGLNTISAVADAFTSRQINTSVITDTGCFSDYSTLTTQTNGILADINSDFSKVLQDLADKVMGVTEKHKKAIYVLPGYMGSKLYDSSGKEIWVDPSALQDDITAHSVPFGDDSILLQNNDGTGTKVHVDMDKDLYGAQDTYEDLMKRLKSEFSKEFDVVFFPYNWLGDLNDSANLLAEDINTKGYKSVVLITHSTGGLLASTYIASSRKNKLKVEKAIMLAPPLFGTYTSLAPIEYGKTSDLDSMLKNNGIENGWLGLKYNLIYNWVKDVTKNSPTTYQLLPSLEYLKLMPQIYKSDFTNPVVTMDKYYSVLNGSGNINSKLTNGNTRSHKFLRDTVFNGNVVKVLQKIDTTLVGSSYGYLTPAIAKYESKLLGGTKITDLVYKKNGDGTVLNVSSAATKDLGVNVLKYKDFKNLSHGDLACKSQVLDYICNVINGISVKFAPAEKGTVLSAAEEEGMSNLLKFNVKADACVDIKVVDSDSNVVASVIEGTPIGFSGIDFAYTSLNTEENKTDSIIYMPNNGLKVIFSFKEAEAVPVNLSVDVSTLGYDGYQTSSATYSALQTGSGGTILGLDFLGKTVDKDNIGSLENGKTALTNIYHDQWEIEGSKVLAKVGDTSTIILTGSDVDSGDILPASLDWSSSNPDIVSVSGEGEIEAKSSGVAYIYAMSKDGNLKVSTCKVTVTQNAKSLSIDNIQMVIGEKFLIEPVFNPSNVTETSMYYDYDTSKGIIDIDENGVITALSNGTIEVVGTAPGGAEAKFKVTVDDNDIIAVQEVKVSPESKTIGINSELTLTAIINPENATNRDVKWYIGEDSAVSIVKTEGDKCIIKGVKAGTADVTVVTNDGGYKAVAKIKVDDTVIEPTSTPTNTLKPTSTPTATKRVSYQHDTPTSTPTPTPTVTPTASAKPTEIPDKKVPGALFPDAINHWSKEYIDILFSKAILDGYLDGTIKPDNEITRAEISVILGKAIGLDTKNNKKIPFKDAESIPNWAASYVGILAERGIIKGYEDGSFRPNNKINRAELVAMVIRANNIKSNNNTLNRFKDSNTIPLWASGYIQAAVNLGILGGYPDNTIRPLDNITRGEAFAIIARVK